jgi:hypothetical protein
MAINMLAIERAVFRTDLFNKKPRTPTLLTTYYICIGMNILEKFSHEIYLTMLATQDHRLKPSAVS